MRRGNAGKLCFADGSRCSQGRTSNSAPAFERRTKGFSRYFLVANDNIIFKTRNCHIAFMGKGCFVSLWRKRPFRIKTRSPSLCRAYNPAMSDQSKTSTAVEDENALAEPPLFKVVMLNDDFTPQDFVVALLERIFAMPTPQAVTVMLQIHHQGSGVCGVYTREIAEIKASQVHSIARRNGHPLKCVLEQT